MITMIKQVNYSNETFIQCYNFKLAFHLLRFFIYHYDSNCSKELEREHCIHYTLSVT